MEHIGRTPDRRVNRGRAVASLLTVEDASHLLELAMDVRVNAYERALAVSRVGEAGRDPATDPFLQAAIAADTKATKTLNNFLRHLSGR